MGGDPLQSKEGQHKGKKQAEGTCIGWAFRREEMATILHIESPRIPWRKKKKI